MKSVLLFSLLSVPVLLYSWKSLKTKQSNGLYCFFSWEAMLVLTSVFGSGTRFHSSRLFRGFSF